MAKVCRMCGSTSPLVKSHVIPAGLLVDPRAPNEPLISGGTSRDFLRRLPTGIWDRFCCQPCEAQSALDDAYLIQVVKSLPFQPTAADGLVTLIQADPVRLRRAILAVLLRAHFCRQEEFSRIDLGPHALTLHDHLYEGAPYPAAFAICLRHLPTVIGTGVFCPFVERWDGINAVRLYLPNLTAMIKVDRRPFLGVWKDYQLEPGRPISALRNEHLSPSENRVFESIYERHSEQYQKFAERAAAAIAQHPSFCRT